MPDLTMALVLQTAIWNKDCLDNSRPGTTRDPRFAAVNKSFWTCQSCGCRSSALEDDLWGGMEVHHKDDNPLNNALDNMLVVCPLCHALLHCDLLLAQNPPGGRLVWAPAIPQTLLTLHAHIRAVCEVRLAPLLDKGVTGAGRAPNGAERLSFLVRDHLALVDRALDSLTLSSGEKGAGAPLGDKTALVEEHPEVFGRVLGNFVRHASAKERQNLALRLHGLRFVFDWRRHPAAATYAGSQVWAAGSSWAETWISEARRLLTLAGVGGQGAPAVPQAP